MTETPARDDGTVPFDSFANRLALVRAEMGWNYDQAEEATTISSESWRTWEKRIRYCSTEVDVARKISAATGISANWIAFGGSLPAAPPKPSRRRRHAAHGHAGTSAYKSAISLKRRNRSVTTRYTRAHLHTTGEATHTRRAA